MLLGCSERFACRALNIHRSSIRYQATKRPSDTDLIQRMEKIKLQHPSWGYRTIAAVMQTEGWEASTKKIYRLYSQEGFAKHRSRRKASAWIRSSRSLVATHPNHVWAADLTTDQDTRGKPLLWFAVMDEYTRQCKILEVYRAIGSKQLIKSFNNCLDTQSKPANLRTDNGGVWSLPKWETWTKDQRVLLRKIPMGCPWENGNIESLIGKLREDLIDRTEFTGIKDANFQAQLWMDRYNDVRPHHSLYRKTPNDFAASQPTD